ncbi:MAG: conserved phage C-terminal domain-containing protein [Clostridia bacterium]|nr:conserved phage C-terminal domain-containing protein [Clostridia bacterium]
MYYTIKIDSAIFSRHGLIAALVYAHLLKVGADVTLSELAAALPYLTYRQIAYARNKLSAAGLIEDCYKNADLTKCRQIVDKLSKHRHTKRGQALLRARIRDKLSISDSLSISNKATNNNCNSNIYLRNEDRDKGGLGEKEKEEEPSKRKKTVVYPQQKALSAEEEAAKNAEKEAEREARTPIYREIINYFNEQAGKHYSYKCDATRRFIDARLAEGRTVEDFKRVIRVKVAEWKGTEHEKYLRPETLFRPSHFESYLNQPEPVEPVAKPKKTEKSFDADEFMAAALAKSYSDQEDGS